jgi:CheY-like chemotaxis protein
MMGGEISVQSEGIEGKGSTFRVTLKNVPVSGILKEVEIRTGEDLDVDRVRFEKALVLVVDDSEMNRRLLREYLIDSDIDVIEAKNGKEAVDLVKNCRPDLVLMDMKMPVMDGCEATRILKADEELKKIPIIIITASAMKGQEEVIKKAGNDGHLSKPMSKSDLIHQLMRFLPYSTLKTAEPTPSTGTPDREDIDSLSPEITAKLPELLSILGSDDLTNRWKKICKTQILDEIHDFSREIRQLGTQYRLHILRNWGDRLFNDLQAYDMQKLAGTLASFPELIKEIEAKYNET